MSLADYSANVIEGIAMTIAATTRKAGPYTGNSVTTAFPFSFKVFAGSEVVVTQTDLSLVETVKTLTTDYTISLNADQDANPGGTVNMVAAPATGYLITLTSNVTQSQGVTLTNGGGFYPKVISDALDRATILIQQLGEKLARAVVVPVSSSTDPTALITTLTTAAATASSAASSASASASSASGSAVAAAASAANLPNAPTGGADNFPKINGTATGWVYRTAAQVLSDIGAAALAAAQTFTKAQRGAVVALTDAATIALDLSLSNNYLVQLGGNRTLGMPTNVVAGQSGEIAVLQDKTGSRTLAYAWPYVWAGGTAGTLSTPGGTNDQLVYSVSAYNSAAATITIATPGVVTMAAHGFYHGQRVQIATTGALPTGLTASTTYFVEVIDANSFHLCTTPANVAAGTRIATSGSQSGVHTLTGCTIRLALNKAYA